MTANGHHTVCLILKWALTIFIIVVIIINKQIIDATAFLTSSFLKISFKTFLTQKRLFKTHMALNYYRPSLDRTDNFAKKKLSYKDSVSILSSCLIKKFIFFLRYMLFGGINVIINWKM